MLILFTYVWSYDCVWSCFILVQVTFKLISLKRSTNFTRMCQALLLQKQSYSYRHEHELTQITTISLNSYRVSSLCWYILIVYRLYFHSFIFYNFHSLMFFSSVNLCRSQCTNLFSNNCVSVYRSYELI